MIREGQAKVYIVVRPDLPLVHRDVSQITFLVWHPRVVDQHYGMAVGMRELHRGLDRGCSDIETDMVTCVGERTK